MLKVEKQGKRIIAVVNMFYLMGLWVILVDKPSKHLYASKLLAIAVAGIQRETVATRSRTTSVNRVLVCIDKHLLGEGRTVFPMTFGKNVSEMSNEMRRSEL